MERQEALDRIGNFRDMLVYEKRRADYVIEGMGFVEFLAERFIEHFPMDVEVENDDLAGGVEAFRDTLEYEQFRSDYVADIEGLAEHLYWEFEKGFPISDEDFKTVIEVLGDAEPAGGEDENN